MKPHFQGQLDGLCGIYSSINATRLIEKISPGQSTALFQKIFSAVERRKSHSSIIKNGLSNRDMAYVFKEVIQKEHPIKRSKPFPRANNIPLETYWRKIQAFLSGDRRKAVIVVIERKDWSHWTVIERATNKTLFLFDSDDQKRIYRRRCTTKKMTRIRPVLLHPTMTYFLWRRE